MLKYNMENTNPITLDREALENMRGFTYLEIIINEQGGSDADVKSRVDKARVTLIQLKNIWDSKQLSVNQREESSIVRSCNAENYYNHHQNSASIYKELSMQDTQDPLAGYHQQQPSVEEDKPASS
ncbi:Laminin subunit gamma-1, variant 2 [Schistosoma haematobium]|uniref:Laminin subunit gamma-1, variant 2 n=1 Tax=Schistosoma haematobium TaxID=6185 RepID=A0A922S133_SCHHA|nr:Laminin subunit gamma-1, variant 2 [Schistosoma haematobium]KAH9588519.1 Laminin subunit gamma-1, variant 2 [Schistosoma haematobium]CAH8572205.1 unnamed protein product [Schistosoma haematobium]